MAVVVHKLAALDVAKAAGRNHDWEDARAVESPKAVRSVTAVEVGESHSAVGRKAGSPIHALTV